MTRVFWKSIKDKVDKLSKFVCLFFHRYFVCITDLLMFVLHLYTLAHFSISGIGYKIL